MNAVQRAFERGCAVRTCVQLGYRVPHPIPVRRRWGPERECRCHEPCAPEIIDDHPIGNCRAVAASTAPRTPGRERKTVLPMRARNKSSRSYRLYPRRNRPVRRDPRSGAARPTGLAGPAAPDPSHQGKGAMPTPRKAAGSLRVQHAQRSDPSCPAPSRPEQASYGAQAKPPSREFDRGVSRRGAPHGGRATNLSAELAMQVFWSLVGNTVATPPTPRSSPNLTLARACRMLAAIVARRRQIRLPHFGGAWRPATKTVGP